LVGSDVLLVERGGVRGRIKPCCDDAQERIAGARQIAVVKDIAGTDQFDARLWMQLLAAHWFHLEADRERRDFFADGK
jgi:hypothetical protein